MSEYRERKKGFSLSCIIHSLGKCFFTVKFSQECGENETETEREREMNKEWISFCRRWLSDFE